MELPACKAVGAYHPQRDMFAGNFVVGAEIDELINVLAVNIIGVEPDDRQIAAARKLYTKVRAYTYLGLGFKDRFVWKYVKCYDCGGRRRKR